MEVAAEAAEAAEAATAAALDNALASAIPWASLKEVGVIGVAVVGAVVGVGFEGGSLEERKFGLCQGWAGADLLLGVLASIS